jgi:predicted nuclease of restriction endonuclease-like RecB superfamily
MLCWCNHFRIHAECLIDGQAATLTLQSGDPIFPSREPRPFDSKLEQRFAREFARHAADWVLAREPEPVEADGTLIFPDFACGAQARFPGC